MLRGEVGETHWRGRSEELSQGSTRVQEEMARDDPWRLGWFREMLRQRGGVAKKGPV